MDNDVNPEDIRQELEFLGHSTFWFHAFKPSVNDEKQKGDLYSEFTSNKDRIIELCKELNGKGVLCVAVNEREEGKTKATDIKTVSALLFDVDVKKELKVGYVSTSEHHEHAIRKAQEEIKPFLEQQGFSVDLIVDSGNGCQLFSKVKLDISTEEARSLFLARITTLEEAVRRFNDDVVEVDFITKDINRRVKLAGTINKKDTCQTEDRLARIVYLNANINVEKNNEAFEQIRAETKEEVKNEALSDDKIGDNRLKEIIGSDFSIKELLTKDTHEKFKSKSEAEQSLVNKLMFRGITAYEDINKIMQSCIIGKWQQSPEQYRKLTYSKALKQYAKHKDHISKGIDSTAEEFLGVKSFNNATTVFINAKGEIYNHLKQVDKNKGVYFETLYTLYEGMIGQGNRPIIIKTKYRIEKGDAKLYLQPLSREDLETTLWHAKQDGLNIICRILKVNLTDKDKNFRERKDIIAELLTFDYTFFEPMLPIDKEEIKKIGNPLRAVQKILKNGLDKDELIDYFSIADIPEVNPNLIEPRNYMKYAPHKIIITNQKVGKSFNAIIVTGESALERPTEAGLLGFADSQNKSYGKLHGRTKQTVVEEVQEEKEEELFGKLHTYLEIGETTIARGVGVNIWGYSGLTFQGNPKIREEVEGNLLDFLMIKQFRDFLCVISKNVKPMASRIGVTVFNTNLKTVTGTPNSSDITDKGSKVIRTLAEGFRDEFTQLFSNQDVIRWLNGEFEPEYKAAVTSISQSCTDRIVKEYIEGQLDSFRHCKGVALRVAWLDKGLEGIWLNGTVDTEELLDNAKDHYATIKSTNLTSYKNIVTLLNGEAYEEILKYNIKNIRPEYVKLSLYALFEWVLGNPQNTSSIIPLAEIEAYYPLVREKLNIGTNHIYRSYARVCDFVKAYKGNLTALLSDLSLDFDKSSDAYIILSRDKIRQNAKKYSDCYNTNNTDNTGTNKEQQKDDNTNNTNNTSGGKSPPSCVKCVTVLSVSEKNLKFSKNDNTNNTNNTDERICSLNSKRGVFDFIRQNDRPNSDGVPIEDIVSACEEPEKADAWLAELAKEGSVFSVRAGFWKVLT